MTHPRKTHFLVLAAITLIAAIATATTTNAQTCQLPPNFVDMPHPTVAAPEQLVAHTEEITVAHSLAQVLETNAKVSLKDAIHKAGSLPGVTGEYPLGQLQFPTPGARHVVCLSDGSTLLEESLELEHTSTFYRFRYIVWNYTSPQARPIEYGVGEFRDSQIDAGHTHIAWTYSFKLKDSKFPGCLGAFGRYLFRVGFLDRDYAAMMRATLHA
jgi:hypothetical protein